MSQKTKPFSITFTSAEDRAPLVDAKGAFTDFASFLRHHAHHLSGADLSGLDLAGYDLSGIVAPGADFSGSDLTRANLDRARLETADFTSACLSHASMKGTKAPETTFEGADLRGADLSGADLAYADLRRARACDVTMDDTDLSSGTFFNADFRGAHGVGTNLAEARLALADFGHCFLVNCTMNGARFQTDDRAAKAWSRDRAASVEGLWHRSRLNGGSYEHIKGDAIPVVVRAERMGMAAVRFAVTSVVATVVAETEVLGDHLITEHTLDLAMKHASYGSLALGGSLAFIAWGARDKIWDFAKDTLGGIMGRVGGFVRSCQERNFPVEREDARKAFKDMVVLMSRDPFAAERLSAAFDAIGADWHGDVIAAAEALVPRRSVGTRIFMCAGGDLVLAMAELAKQAKGQSWGTSILVNPAALARRDTSYPAIVRAQGGVTEVGWVSRPSGAAEDTWVVASYDDKGRIVDATIRQGETRRVLRSGSPEMTRLDLPALSESLDAMRRDARAASWTEATAGLDRARVAMSAPSGSHVVRMESVRGRNAYVCRRATGSPSPGKIDNPNGPAVIASDGRELFYRDGAPIPTPGTLDDVPLEPSLAGM